MGQQLPLAGTVGGHVGNHQARPLAGETQRGGAADAAGRAGDERDLAGEAGHGRPKRSMAAAAARANSTPMPRAARLIGQVFVMALTVDPPLAQKGVLPAPLSRSAARELASGTWIARARSGSS